MLVDYASESDNSDAKLTQVDSPHDRSDVPKPKKIKLSNAAEFLSGSITIARHTNEDNQINSDQIIEEELSNSENEKYVSKNTYQSSYNAVPPPLSSVSLGGDKKSVSRGMGQNMTLAGMVERSIFGNKRTHLQADTDSKEHVSRAAQRALNFVPPQVRSKRKNINTEDVE
eukprot:GHVR01000845.1.p1 GENE.GHVR01000845.1~~GHVR01000845.1.p1  ORF type:complete len:183 (+),score=25.29 GHVR01000845.1:37-549(+)